MRVTEEIIRVGLGRIRRARHGVRAMVVVVMSLVVVFMKVSESFRDQIAASFCGT